MTEKHPTFTEKMMDTLANEVSRIAVSRFPKNIAIVAIYGSLALDKQTEASDLDMVKAFGGVQYLWGGHQYQFHSGLTFHKKSSVHPTLLEQDQALRVHVLHDQDQHYPYRSYSLQQ